MPDHVCRLFHRATRSGDDEAWRDLVAACHGPLRHRLRGLIGRRRLRITVQESEELVQDLWCRLVDLPESARFRGRTDAELWAWLQRILRRLVLDFERKRDAAKRKADLVGDDWRADGGISWRDSVAEPGPDPETRVLRRERARRVERTCREVSGPGRAGLTLRILRLALIEGFSSLDVARRLGAGLEASHVDGLLYRLRGRLAARGLTLPHRSAFLAGGEVG